jgi:capsule polysaccharide export protein KpsC/LpsZ
LTTKVKTVDEYKNSFTFVIKEHPNVFGFRTNNFYSALINKANVILVNPEVSSNELIEACDYILVCTGTVGFESLLRGKPVISGCAPYYASRDGFLNFDDLDICCLDFFLVLLLMTGVGLRNWS